MLVLSKRNIDLPGPDGASVRLRRGELAVVPDWAADTEYFKALVADGKVVPSGRSDKQQLPRSYMAVPTAPSPIWA